MKKKEASFSYCALKVLLFSEVFLLLFTSCESSKTTDHKKPTSANSLNTPISETDQDSSGEEILQSDENNQVVISESDNLLGVNIPKGALHQDLNPKINISSIRKNFEDILSSGIVNKEIGEGRTVILGQGESNESTSIDSTNLQKNYEINFLLNKNDVEDINKIGLVMRIHKDGSEDETRIIPESILTKSSVGDNFNLSFKVSDTNIDLQPVILESENINAKDLYYPAPEEPQNLKCTATSHDSINLSWTSRGGFVSAYRIVYASGTNTVATANACSAGTVLGGADFPGTSTSKLISGLSSDTEYDIRLCAVAVAIPENKISSGVTCKVKTPLPENVRMKIALQTGTDGFKFYDRQSTAPIGNNLNSVTWNTNLDSTFLDTFVYFDFRYNFLTTPKTEDNEYKK